MNKIAGHFLKGAAESQVAGYEPPNPHYEEYTDAKGVKRRRKRELPPGLSKRDGKILKKVRRRAHYLDKGLVICGFRFGWALFIGLIPVIGDLFNFFLAYRLVISPSMKCDLPSTLKSRMMLNQLIASGVGFVPFVGDIIMAIYKPNSRNAHLLEGFLIERARHSPTDNQEQIAADSIEHTNHQGFSKRTGDPNPGPGQYGAVSSSSTPVVPPRPANGAVTTPARTTR